ncbi:uncharacterized protein LOC127122979 [Lathyrus oleraceus]|uniref:uncharacterized protein LOC127122979 n=1 Tax=Pisum sativum TaxID=3888 RepID=UPI0021CEA3FF|nr:uncharacterized protein LOC127122979 [Pisum sativum]
MKDEIVRLTVLMESVIATQNQTSPPPTTPPSQRTIISEISSPSVPIVATSQSSPAMPAGFPWGTPPNFIHEGYAPTFASLPASSLVMFVPPPIVHTLPCVEETIYHSEPSGGPDVYGKMDEIKNQFLKLRKELKTLRGKDLFGKSAAELCLVPNVKIPVNVKDSLTGAALRWYMGLDSASIHSFNDLSEAFVKKYKYNVDMAPDRDQLRSMYHKDKKTFKEYAQRWRELAAQISPPLEEKDVGYMCCYQFW